MSFQIVRKLPVRLAPGLLHSTVRRSQNPAIFLPITTHRNATSSSHSDSLQGKSGDLGNPQSVSSEQSSIKTSRATDGGSPDTASIQTPVSNQSKIPGEQDESTPSHDEVKRDPNEPAEEKRKHVERQGEKPLGEEDKQ